MKKKKGVKLQKVQLTQQEIWDSLRVPPPPFKSKKITLEIMLLFGDNN